MRKHLKKIGLDCSIQLFSALRKEGLEELAGVMGHWYDYKLGADGTIEQEASETVTTQNNDIEVGGSSSNNSEH
jgi:GTP-binding protein